MSGNHHERGAQATLRGREDHTGPNLPAVRATGDGPVHGDDHSPGHPLGHGLTHPDPITSLAPAGEPVWWWLTLLAPRAALTFLLWATRSPHHALTAAWILGGITLASILLGAWS